MLVGAGMGAAVGLLLRRTLGSVLATIGATAICAAGKMLDEEALRIGGLVDRHPGGGRHAGHVGQPVTTPTPPQDDGATAAKAASTSSSRSGLGRATRCTPGKPNEAQSRTTTR